MLVPLELALAAYLEAGQSKSSAPVMETISINVQAPVHPFPHYWERMFGSGRAILSLRESYRNDLRAVKAATRFEYVRFHGILDDEVGVYSEDKRGNPVYNFTYVDQIYDGLLAEGVKPFVELSFMPRALAAQPIRHPFWYHPYTSPPKSWKRWGDLVEALARHLVSRYGINEVSQWYFEVWNEPNIDFWSGNPKESTYFHLYDVTARAIKRVSPRLRVGGPATAQAAWVSRFIQHCVQEKVPVDFVSTHIYGNDSPEKVLGTHRAVPRDQMVYLAVRKVHDEVKASPRPNLPIIFSEFNATYLNQVDVTDSPFIGPWLAHTIAQCDGLVHILSYWTFSDVFEEQGVAKKPFYGGYGLIAVGNIPKAAFNDFKLLHELGSERLELNSDSALATRRADGRLAIAVWNYSPAKHAGPARRVTLELHGFHGKPVASIQIVDSSHGSPLATWEAMGRPAFPTRKQQEQLRAAARLATPRRVSLQPGPPAGLTLTLAPYALALVEVGE